MKFFDDAKLKAAVWWRERKEKAEERKAAHAEPPGVTIPLSLVRSAKLAAWMAYFSLVYFLWLYTLDIARDRAASLHLTHVGAWIGEIQFFFPYIVGFAIVAIGIPYVAKIAIPTFMSLSWRGNFWPKLWALFIAVAVSLVVIAGTFTVQGDTILERDRDSAVAVEQVQIAAATLNAQIGDVQHAMDERTQSPSAYVRTAASMSPEAYDRFVAARVGDPQYQRLLSYRAVSEEMVALNQRMSELRAQQAQSTAVASVQGVVTTERTGWIANTLGWLEGARAMLLSFVMDIVCLIMPWIALRLEQARNRQVGMAEGIAPHPWMLRDMRAEEAVRDDPARDARDVADAMMSAGADPRFAEDMARSAADRTMRQKEMYDAQTGDKLVWRKGAWVRPPTRKGKAVSGTMEFAGDDALPEDRGVEHDGGNRIAQTPAGPIDLDNPGVAPSAFEVNVEAKPYDEDQSGDRDASEDHRSKLGREGHSEAETEQQGQSDNNGDASLQSSDLVQETPPEELGDDDAAFLDEAPVEPVSADEREEPETDERRMIAANVAAE